jgi:general secretion pathway protein K
MSDSGLLHQRGVALITALLVVALATTAAVAMSFQHQIFLRRSANILDGDQALMYVLGAEDYARVTLARDRLEGNVDHLGEAWAFQLPALPVPGGQVTARLEDLDRRMNINNLVSADGQRPDRVWIDRFARLLESLQIDVTLVQAIVDWIDWNVQPELPAGAEDDYYTRLDPPYRAANRPMAHISELRLVKGVTPQIYGALLPYVTALPPGSKINVNTALPEVLATLSSLMSLTQAQSIADRRTSGPFESVGQFKMSDVLRGATDISTAGLAVTSDYFELHALAELGEGRVPLNSLLLRQGPGIITVLARDHNPF